MKKLLIFESPEKAKHVAEFAKNIGENIVTAASNGHIRGLANVGDYNIGVIIDDKDIIPKWTILNNKKVSELTEKANSADEIILTTDPDREGEAIAWHLYDVLHNIKGINKPFKRMRMNEITETELIKQLKNINQIDQNLVDAATSRAILDKTVGFTLSSLLNEKVGGKSAGRVQSATLLLIKERESDIKSFKKMMSYQPIMKTGLNSLTLKPFKNEIELENSKKYKIKALAFDNKEDGDNFINNISDNLEMGECVDLFEETTFSNPFKPFATDDAYKHINKRIGLNSKQSAKELQSLYESGLITYIRTDSNNISKETQDEIKKYCTENLNLKAVDNISFKEAAGAQDGHPAITPTNVNVTKSSKELEKLTETQRLIYQLIWENTVASMLKPAEILSKKIELTFEDKKILWEGSVKYIKEPNVLSFGELLQQPFDKEENQNMKEQFELISHTNLDWIKPLEIKLNEVESKPKSHFNELTLLSELKKRGIGRPSTYSSAVNVNLEKGYVYLGKKGEMLLTDLGDKSISFLSSEFPEIINVNYTKQMEEELDKIAKGTLLGSDFISKNYFNVKEKVNQKETEIFSQLEICPKCKKGKLKIRTTKKGDSFKGCSNWPECDYTEQILPDNADKCDKCKIGFLLINKTKTGDKYQYCSNKECEYVDWNYGKPKCKICKKGVIYKGVSKNNISYEKCSNKECEYIKFK